MISLTLTRILSLPSVPFEYRDLLPESSGIYFVLTRTPLPHLVYIGKAKNLNERWMYHHREPELSLLLKLDLNVDIAYLELRCSEDWLLKTERKLINELNPALNDEASMPVEVRKLANKIASIEEFVVQEKSSALPDLSQIEKPTPEPILQIEDFVKIQSCINQGLNQEQTILEVWGMRKGGNEKYKERAILYKKALSYLQEQEQEDSNQI